MTRINSNHYSRREFSRLLLGTATAGLVSSRPELAAPTTASPITRTQSNRPFVMDVHIHMAQPGNRPRSEVLAELYRPWKYVYGADGEWIPKPTDLTPTARDLIEVMDRGGIDVAVVMPSDHARVAKIEGHWIPPTSNDYIAEQVRQFPERLIGICGHDPLREHWKAPRELERMVKEHGFRGMKLYPPYDHFDPGDERLFPLYEKAIELDVVLTFHTGWTPWVNAPIKFGKPELVDPVGARYPELKVNLAHIGGVSWWREAVLVTARHKNFTMDVSSWCTYPPSDLVAMLNLARDLVGLDRVLFGSEHTLCDPGIFVAEIQNINLFAERYHFLPFEDRDIRKILGENAARVYGIEAKKKM